jgi:hypothetical protein
MSNIDLPYGKSEYVKSKRESLGFSLSKMAALAELDDIALKNFEAGSGRLDTQEIDSLDAVIADEIAKRRQNPLASMYNLLSPPARIAP